MFQIYGTQEAYQVFDFKAIFKSLIVEDSPPGWNSDVVFSFKEPWIYSNNIEKSQANFNQGNGMICNFKHWFVQSGENEWDKEKQD